MKKLLALLICGIAVLTATGCSKSDDSNSSFVSTPEINEFGIQMSVEDLLSAFSEKSNQTIDKENPGSGYFVGGKPDDRIDMEMESNRISHLIVSCSGATEDKANTAERATDYFKSVLSILYPNTDSDEISNLLKQIRYDEAENDNPSKGYLFNDIYITYQTSFGASGLTLSNEKVTIVYWRIESIEFFNK